MEDKRKMPVFASSKGEFAERMTTFMSSFVRPVGMLLVISFISGECFCSIECKSPHKLSMYLFYPLILHPLLIISELARNYPLVIRKLSYTKSKKDEDFLVFLLLFYYLCIAIRLRHKTAEAERDQTKIVKLHVKGRPTGADKSPRADGQKSQTGGQNSQAGGKNSTCTVEKCPVSLPSDSQFDAQPSTPPFLR